MILGTTPIHQSHRCFFLSSIEFQVKPLKISEFRIWNKFSRKASSFVFVWISLTASVAVADAVVSNKSFSGGLAFI